MPDAERLIEIETRLAFQERQIGRLEEALRAQQKLVERLNTLVEMLRRRAMSGPGDDASSEPPPPHYL